MLRLGVAHRRRAHGSQLRQNRAKEWNHSENEGMKLKFINEVDNIDLNSEIKM